MSIREDVELMMQSGWTHESAELLVQAERSGAEPAISKLLCRMRQTEYPRIRRPSIPAAVRKAVYERDAYRCQSCGGWIDLSVDHIEPLSRGGKNCIDNLQTLCMPCNIKKAATNA